MILKTERLISFVQSGFLQGHKRTNDHTFFWENIPQFSNKERTNISRLNRPKGINLFARLIYLPTNWSFQHFPNGKQNFPEDHLPFVQLSLPIRQLQLWEKNKHKHSLLDFKSSFPHDSKHQAVPMKFLQQPMVFFQSSILGLERDPSDVLIPFLTVTERHGVGKQENIEPRVVKPEPKSKSPADQVRQNTDDRKQSWIAWRVQSISADNCSRRRSV